MEGLFGGAARKLTHVFGITLKLLHNEKQAPSYLVVNNLDPITNLGDSEIISQHLQQTEDEQATRGLLFTILSLIFMSGGKIRDDQLVAFLKKVGLQGEEQDEINKATISSFGGNVKQLIDKEFAARQHYIEIKKEEGPDPDNPLFEYQWGERAELEIVKSRMLKQVCKIYKCPITVFEDLVEKIKKEEGEKAFDEEEEEAANAEQEDDNEGDHDEDME